VKFLLSVSIGHNKFIIKDTVWNVCIYQQYLWQCYQQRWSSSDCLKWLWTKIQGHFSSYYNSGACKNFSSDICKCQKHTISEAVYTFFTKYVKKIRLTQNNLRYNKTNPVTNAGFTQIKNVSSTSSRDYMKKVKRNKHWHNNGSTTKICNKWTHNSYNKHHVLEI
jgi:hypothetical protein